MLASRLAALVPRKSSMFSSSRLKACTSRTPAMRLLQIGVDAADGHPGLAEGLARLAGEPEGGHGHHRQHDHADQGVGDAQGQHGGQDPDDQQGAPDDVDQGEAERLLDGVDVVGDPAHQAPGLVARSSSPGRGGAGGGRAAGAAVAATRCPAQVMRKNCSPARRPDDEEGHHHQHQLPQPGQVRLGAAPRRQGGVPAARSPLLPAPLVAGVRKQSTACPDQLRGPHLGVGAPTMVSGHQQQHRPVGPEVARQAAQGGARPDSAWRSPGPSSGPVRP